MALAPAPRPRSPETAKAGSAEDGWTACAGRHSQGWVGLLVCGRPQAMAWLVSQDPLPCRICHFCRVSALSLPARSEEHTSELQSPCNLVCRLLLEKKKKRSTRRRANTVSECRSRME